MPRDKIRKISSHSRRPNFFRWSQARPWGRVAGAELGKVRSVSACVNQREMFPENALPDWHHGKSNKATGLTEKQKKNHPL